MPDFIYTGDKESMVAYGFTFPPGEPVPVPEDAVAYRIKRPGKDNKLEQRDVLVVDKLRGNREFQEVAGPSPEEVAAAKAAEAEAKAQAKAEAEAKKKAEAEAKAQAKG